MWRPWMGDSFFRFPDQKPPDLRQSRSSNITSASSFTMRSMMIRRVAPEEFSQRARQPEKLAGVACVEPVTSIGREIRVALLTPYNGGNLGDAAIQDAFTANFRLRIPEAQFSGICLNCDNFQERHGIGAFPLCATDRPFYSMFRGLLRDDSSSGPLAANTANQKAHRESTVKTFLRSVPGLSRCWKAFRKWVGTLPRELRHCITGYHFLRTQDLLGGLGRWATG